MPISAKTKIELVGPHTSDGRPIFTPALFRGELNIYYAGVGDDYAGGNRGGGQAFHVKKTGPTTSPHEQVSWQFIDEVYIVGGRVITPKGGEGDSVHLDLIAPATALVVNTPVTGNCNLSDLDGTLPAAICIVPTAGDGTHDVDLDTAVNANLDDKADGSKPNKVTAASPVPAIAKDAEGNEVGIGYYNYDYTTGVITEAAAGDGWWNLFAANITLTRWVAGWQIWDLTDGATGDEIKHEFHTQTKAKKILPHWICRVTMELVSSNSVRASWGLYLGREKST